jgi:acetyl esterase/lipase
MHRLKKIALKALSYPVIDLKKDYEKKRRIVNALHPYFKPKYKLMDYKITLGDRDIPVRVFLPEQYETVKALIFFHGGGWVTGNIDSYTTICANMANETKHMVISVDYLLAPENPFPKGFEDCYHVTREIFVKKLLNCKTEDITLIGDSAGGNLAAAVSLAARDRGEFLPTKQILLYPSTYNDHSESSPFPSIHENGTGYILTSKNIQDYMELYVQNEEYRNSPYVAPLISEDLSEQPKTLIITAEFDPLRDEGEAYGKRLKDFGNSAWVYRMKDAVHGFISLPRKSEHVIESYKIINRFLNEYTDGMMESNETTEKGRMEQA